MFIDIDEKIANLYSVIKLMDTENSKYIFSEIMDNVIEVKINKKLTNPLVHIEDDYELFLDNLIVEEDEVLQIFIERNKVGNKEDIQRSRDKLLKEAESFEFGGVSNYLYEEIDDDLLQKSDLLYRLELNYSYNLEEIDIIAAIILDLLIELFVEEIESFDNQKQKGILIQDTIQELLFLNASDLIESVKFLDSYEYELFEKGKAINIEKIIEQIEMHYDHISNKFKVPKHLIGVYTYCLMLNSRWIDTNGKILNQKVLNLKNSKNKYVNNEESKKYYSTLHNNFRVFCEVLNDFPISENNISANVFLFNKYSNLFDIFLLIETSFKFATGDLSENKKHFIKAENENFIEILKIPGMLNLKRTIQHSKYEKFIEEPLHIEYLKRLISSIRASILSTLKTKYNENYRVEIIQLIEKLDPYSTWIEKINDYEWFNFNNEKKGEFAKIFSVYCKVIYDKIVRNEKEN